MRGTITHYGCKQPTFKMLFLNFLIGLSAIVRKSKRPKRPLTQTTTNRMASWRLHQINAWIQKNCSRVRYVYRFVTYTIIFVRFIISIETIIAARQDEISISINLVNNSGSRSRNLIIMKIVISTSRFSSTFISMLHFAHALNALKPVGVTQTYVCHCL